MQRNGATLDECREVLTHRVTSIRGLSETLRAEMPGPSSEDRTQAVEALCRSLRKLQDGLHGLKRAVRTRADGPAERRLVQ